MKVVVKIGTNVVCEESGKPDPIYIYNLAEEVTALIQSGTEVSIVMSGAIGAGMEILGMKNRPQEIGLRQACASVGQGRLMHMLQEAFSHYRGRVGQVLVTKKTFDDEASRRHMVEAIHELTKLKVCPIVNENDVIATDEIDSNFGDNDELSVLFAETISATHLLLLTSVDGVSDGKKVMPALKLSEIDSVPALGSSSLGVGGIKSKLEAARKAVEKGIQVAITGGRQNKVINHFLSGEIRGTYILSETD